MGGTYITECDNGDKSSYNECVVNSDDLGGLRRKVQLTISSTWHRCIEFNEPSPAWGQFLIIKGVEFTSDLQAQRPLIPIAESGTRDSLIHSTFGASRGYRRGSDGDQP